MRKNTKATTDHETRVQLDPTAYERPEITDLGTLKDLTLGGNVPFTDASNGTGS